MLLIAKHHYDPTDPKVKDLIEHAISRHGGRVLEWGTVSDEKFFQFDAALPRGAITVLNDLLNLPVRWKSLEIHP